MLKMRKIPQFTVRLTAVRVAAAAILSAPLLLSQSVSAASLKVCTSAGDACSKFVNKYIAPIIVLLTVLVGVFAVISIIVAAIQYSSAGDDPSAVGKAKNRIFKTVLGLFGYIFLFAFLNFLVPGGLF
jgi:hypothetical protein